MIFPWVSFFVQPYGQSGTILYILIPWLFGAGNDLAKATCYKYKGRWSFIPGIRFSPL